MSRSRRWRWLIAALLTSAPGCTTFDAISPRVGLTRPAIEVQFATPLRLVARSHTGEEVVRPHVTRVVGRPVEVRNDTLVLAITRWEASARWWYESPPLVATLPTSDAGTYIGTRRISAWRTAAVILGPPVAAFLLFAIVCSIDPCFN